jgi:phenylalanyl-tRNA synthetase alpha chain
MKFTLSWLKDQFDPSATLGLDHIAMLKYGIPDLRAFFEADLRWLRHYGFKALHIPTLAGGLS